MMETNTDEDRLTKDFPKHNWLEKKYFVAHPEQTARNETLNQAQDGNKIEDETLEIIYFDDHNVEDKSKNYISKPFPSTMESNSTKENTTFTSKSELIFHRLPVKPAPSFLDTSICKIVNSCKRKEDKGTQVTCSDIYKEWNEIRDPKFQYFSNLICILNNKIISINEATLMLNSRSNISHPCKQITNVPEEKNNANIVEKTKLKKTKSDMNINNYPIDLTKRDKVDEGTVHFKNNDNTPRWKNISKRNQNCNYSTFNNYQMHKSLTIKTKAHKTITAGSRRNLTYDTQYTNAHKHIPADNSINNYRKHVRNIVNASKIRDSYRTPHAITNLLLDSSRSDEHQYNVSNGSKNNVFNNPQRTQRSHQINSNYYNYNFLNSLTSNPDYAEQRRLNYSDVNNAFGHKDYRPLPYSSGTNYFTDDLRYQCFPSYPPQYYLPNSYLSYPHNSKTNNFGSSL